MPSVGISLPSRPEPGAAAPARFLSDAAVAIEQAGFSGAWVFDNIGRGRASIPDPLTALAVAATVTDRIELGTSVLQLSLRPVVEVAHRVMTLDMLAPGRVLLGVGAGSTESDFIALENPHFEARFRRLGQSLDELRMLLRGEEVRGARLLQWEFRDPAPRILIGTWGGSRWLRRAVEEQDGWIASAAKTGWAQLETGMTEFRALGGERSIVVNVPFSIEDADPDDDRPVLVGTLGSVKERWARLRDLGFSTVVVSPTSRTPAGLEQLNRVLDL